MKVITLDPGHGGADPGAVLGSRYEKDDNLRMAKAVQKILEEKGQKVVMTRSGDTFVPLLERSTISNRNGADLFVSFHRNAVDNPAANGVENLVQLGAPAATRKAAQTVLDKIIKVGGWVNRGLKEGNLSVLRNTNAPAMLLELGFITNSKDNQLFDQNFDAYARAIADGILTALGVSAIAPPSPPPVGSDPVIKTIQQTLNERYGLGLKADGIYGPMTKAGIVKGLQIELNTLFNAGLTVDGIFGPRTRAAVPLLRRGSRGNLVYILQALLYVNGIRFALDGVFGPATEDAVKQYQNRAKLPVDGIAGPQTFAALLS